MQVLSLISGIHLGVRVKAEHQVRLFRGLRAGGYNFPLGIRSFAGGKREGMRVVFTLRGPPSPPAVTLHFCRGPPFAQRAMEGGSQAGMPSCRETLPHWSCWDQ